MLNGLHLLGILALLDIRNRQAIEQKFSCSDFLVVILQTGGQEFSLTEILSEYDKKKGGKAAKITLR